MNHDKILERGFDEETMEKTLKKRLKELRKAYGYSQKEVADYLEVDQSNFSKMERNIRNLNSTHLTKLCLLYGCSEDYVLGLSDEFEKPKISFKSNEKVDFKAIATINNVKNYLSLLKRLDGI